MRPFKVTMLASMLPKLISLVQTGVQHYGSLRAAGMEVNPAIVALYLSTHVEGWNPTVQGTPMLDHETKTAGCRFLGGLACNLGEHLNRAEDQP